MSELRLVVRLWLRPDTDVAEFEVMERRAAQVMKTHGGRIERAFRAHSHTDSNEPFEVHLVSFPDQTAFDAYRADKRSLALASRRERLILRTEIWRGEEVHYGF